MSNIAQVLFNTNHEMPNIWVVLIIGVITIGASALNSYYRNSKAPDSKKNQNKKK